MSNFVDLAKEYGKEAEHEAKAFDDGKDVCHMVVHDHFIIKIEPSLKPECFTIFAVIGQVTPSTNESLFKNFLSANLFHRETGKGSLAYDEKSSNVLLFQDLANNIQYEDFKNDLNLFLAYLYYWQDKLQAMLDDSHSSEVHTIDSHMTTLLGKQNKLLFFA